MRGVICTLAEGRHFLGLAALMNSLRETGFDGELFVGYRGEVPGWLLREVERTEQSPGRPRLRLLRFDERGHMTNLKPDWILRVWAMRPDAERLVYLDPDICVLAPWRLIENWIGRGVAAAQDQQPALPTGHWLFKGWQEAFSPKGYLLRETPREYVNAGFLGVHRDAVGVVERWRDMMRIAAEAFGGLDASNLSRGRKTEQISTPYTSFAQTDQDVLNAVLRCGSEPLSLVGPEGMGFRPGPALMSHAVGQKPWAKPFIWQAMRGIRPTLADQMFLKFSSGPLRAINTLGLTLLSVRLQVARVLTARVKTP